MGDDGAAGSRPAAPSNSVYRELSMALGAILTSMREREASRSSKSSPGNAVRPTIHQCFLAVMRRGPSDLSSDMSKDCELKLLYEALRYTGRLTGLCCVV